MGNIVMILKRAPYGDINAAEAVRHAIGGVADDLAVHLVLVDGGVLLAKKDHDETGTGFTNLERALKDCIDMGVEVYADQSSLKEYYLNTEDIVEGVNVVEGAKIAELVRGAKTTVIF